MSPHGGGGHGHTTRSHPSASKTQQSVFGKFVPTVAIHQPIPTTERWARALKDLKDHDDYKEPTGIKGVWHHIEHTADHWLHKAGDIYTSAQYWLQSNYPRGYILVFLLVSLLSSSLYVFDITTDIIVAKTLLESDEPEFQLYGIVVLCISLNHYFIIATMLFYKFFYFLDETVLTKIRNARMPWEEEEAPAVGGHPYMLVGAGGGGGAGGAGGRGRVNAGATPILSLLLPSDIKMTGWMWRVEMWVWWALGGLIRLLLQAIAVVLAAVMTLVLVPWLDLAMMGTELWMGALTCMAESDLRDRLLRATNFLLQYQTVRIPSECFLESIPQTGYQSYLYFRLKGKISLPQLVQSISVSAFNVCKNLMDIYFNYKISGFSFPAYVRNALQFEGAAALPMRWNSLRSSLAERLVLWGDFFRLAHAQKMKLFQAALFRKRIVVTTHPERWVGEECVIVVSSWLMGGFIADSLPVSLGYEESDAIMVLHLENTVKLPWRDDVRHTGKKAAERLKTAVWNSVDVLINAPTMWQNLAEVMLVDAGLQEQHADGLSEMLVRSRCLRLVLSGNALGDEGVAVLAGGLNLNTSLKELRLDRNKLTAVGVYHLVQGLGCHVCLSTLALGWNVLGDTGCEHVADMLACVPSLTSLGLPGVGAGPAGIKAIGQAVVKHGGLQRLDLTSNAKGTAADGVGAINLMLREAPHLKALSLGGCNLGQSGCQSLSVALSNTSTLQCLDLSHTYLTPAALTALCEALETRHTVFMHQQRIIRSQEKSLAVSLHISASSSRGRDRSAAAYSAGGFAEEDECERDGGDEDKQQLISRAEEEPPATRPGLFPRVALKLANITRSLSGRMRRNSLMSSGSGASGLPPAALSGRNSQSQVQILNRTGTQSRMAFAGSSDNLAVYAAGQDMSGTDAGQDSFLSGDGPHTSLGLNSNPSVSAPSVSAASAAMTTRSSGGWLGRSASGSNQQRRAQPTNRVQPVAEERPATAPHPSALPSAPRPINTSGAAVSGDGRTRGVGSAWTVSGSPNSSHEAPSNAEGGTAESSHRAGGAARPPRPSRPFGASYVPVDGEEEGLIQAHRPSNAGQNSPSHGTEAAESSRSHSATEPPGSISAGHSTVNSLAVVDESKPEAGSATRLHMLLGGSGPTNDSAAGARLLLAAGKATSNPNHLPPSALMHRNSTNPGSDSPANPVPPAKRVTLAQTALSQMSLLASKGSMFGTSKGSGGMWPSLGKLKRVAVASSSSRHDLNNLNDHESAAPLPDMIVETPYLQELRLADCGIRGKELDRLCAVLADSPGLTILDLSGNCLAQCGLTPLADLLHAQRATLLKLSLVRCQLCPASLAANSSAHQLGMLVECDLSHNPLGDAGLARLGAAVLEAPTAPTLQVLRLNDVSAGSAGFNALLLGLALNTCLKELSCCSNHIGAVDMHRWSRFTSSNKTLRLLDLRENALGPTWCRDMNNAASASPYLTLLM